MSSSSRIIRATQVIAIALIYAALMFFWFASGTLIERNPVLEWATALTLGALIIALAVISRREPADRAAARERREHREKDLRTRMQESGARAQPVSPHEVERVAAEMEEAAEEPLFYPGQDKLRHEDKKRERRARRFLRLGRRKKEERTLASAEPQFRHGETPILLRSAWSRHTLTLACIAWLLFCGNGCVAAMQRGNPGPIRISAPFLLILGVLPGLLLIKLQSLDRRTNARRRRRSWRLGQRSDTSR